MTRYLIGRGTTPFAVIWYGREYHRGKWGRADRHWSGIVLWRLGIWWSL